MGRIVPWGKMQGSRRGRRRYGMQNRTTKAARVRGDAAPTKNRRRRRIGRWAAPCHREKCTGAGEDTGRCRMQNRTTKAAQNRTTKAKADRLKGGRYETKLKTPASRQKPARPARNAGKGVRYKSNVKTADREPRRWPRRNLKGPRGVRKARGRPELHERQRLAIANWSS